MSNASNLVMGPSIPISQSKRDASGWFSFCLECFCELHVTKLGRCLAAWHFSLYKSRFLPVPLSAPHPSARAYACQWGFVRDRVFASWKLQLFDCSCWSSDRLGIFGKQPVRPLSEPLFVDVFTLCETPKKRLQWSLTNLKRSLA